MMGLASRVTIWYSCLRFYYLVLVDIARASCTSWQPATPHWLLHCVLRSIRQQHSSLEVTTPLSVSLLNLPPSPRTWQYFKFIN